MNLSLFSTKSSESGFRLHTYEVWNWGTFDHQVWTVHPDGETSLLTGANASGKTTLVDGLLTLLVPEKRMRFYNQTAGSKGERTEDSYVTGEYGETENTDTNTREIKKLRGDKSKAQSVLLAVFQNESQFVTLVQARWFSSGELKRTFMLSYKKLSIISDFSPFDNHGDWKKRLKQKYPKQGSKELLHVMDSPGEYGRLMRKVFGMRSEKAHTLFSQTIGLKVLGNLDEFVRMQMLEERESEIEFQKIKTYFKTLNDAHKAIEKAHKQIELLRPIRDKAIALSRHQADLLLYENHKSAAPLWFAQKQKDLINEFIVEKNSDCELLAQGKENLERAISDLSDQERELDIQIRDDEVGKQIIDWERKNKDLEATKAEREEALKHYNELAENLEFQVNIQTKEMFDEQRKEAVAKKKKAIEIVEQNEKELDSVKIQKHTLDQQLNEILDELNALRSQKNNIPGSPARIRNEILENMGATEKEIPFIGELMRIREAAREWESAIERLLHNFALRIIVPEEYYQQVNQYVNLHDLRGRIIYHKFNKKEVAPKIFQQINDKELIHKLEFKSSFYTYWIKSEIKTKFNYICTDDLEEFRLAEKALTRHGLTKSASRHEKDDRPEIQNRQQFVLGWDNKEKIAALRQEADQLDKQIAQVNNRITYLKNHQKRLKEEEDNLTRFIEFNSFKRIDWWSLSAQIQENNLRIEELEKTNDQVNTLKKQRDEILKVLKVKNYELDDLKGKLRDMASGIDQQRQKLSEAQVVIDQYSGLEINEKLIQFESEFIQEYLINISIMDTIQKQISQKINDGMDALKNEIRKESSAAETLMRTFTNPGKAITDQFEDWNADTHRLRENAEFIDDYVVLLEKIEKQELAEYQQQFKKYLNEEMITKMSDFQTWLERQEEDIEENIETLNKSLQKINFKHNPPTFIKLHAVKDYTPRVKEFKIRLNDWKPNLIEFERTKNANILEQSFTKIKSLLGHLTADENTRKEVLDVRNWLKFKAIEHHREDLTKVFRIYTGTAKLSGGEGAQLTYTILGSAIAYQFGIHSEGLNTNSFRFICVDEAFSKQDDEKARFLMELCKQLHLQVMVVSPAKAEEVAIVEPYIARVHFVQRKDNRHSVVFDMPIKQLQEHRQQYFQSVI